MELELNLEHINCYDMVLGTSICQEETTEAIVPDACPDILRIVDTVGQICISGKNVHEGGVSVSGTVVANILYQPEDGQKLCRMEVKIPFASQSDVGGLGSMGQCVAVPHLRSLDARALNPRKVLVRADIAIELQCYQPREWKLCRELTCDEQAGIQQRTIQCTTCLTTSVQEKEFISYNEVRLSSGPSGMVQLLSVCVQPWCSESKVIGNKLIFKGDLILQTRYLVEGELCSMRCPVAFSQIMEVAGVGEAADCTVDICVTGVDCSMSGEDGRTMNVTLDLLAQASVRDQYPLMLLQDAYSTAYEMTTEQENCQLPRLLEHSIRPQSVREVLEISTMVKHVVDACLSVIQVKQGREDAQQSLIAELLLKLVYQDEQDNIQTLERVISASGRLELPGLARCQCRCTCPGEVFAVPTAGGVEIRFNLEFHCLITAWNTVPVICGAKLGGKRSTQSDSQPSVVLRLAAPGETLWDIAKSYSTTQERILQANQLEGDLLPVGQMLLIPSIR